MEERCNDCKYWKQHYETSCGGKCRRLPPVLDGLQILFAKDNGHQDEFADESILWWSQPATSFDDWCGEFVKRPNAELTGARRASALSAGLGARPVNCDQVAWMLNAIERYLPPTQHPRVSRSREMQKYALLYELMEVAHLYFEDASAQHNGTPGDVRRFQYASKQAEAAAHQGMNIAGNGAQSLGQLMREQARSEIRGGPVPFA